MLPLPLQIRKPQAKKRPIRVRKVLSLNPQNTIHLILLKMSMARYRYSIFNFQFATFNNAFVSKQKNSIHIGGPQKTLNFPLKIIYFSPQW